MSDTELRCERCGTALREVHESTEFPGEHLCLGCFAAASGVYATEATENEFAVDPATDPRRDGTVQPPADALRDSRVDLVERIEQGIPEREFVPGCDPYLIRGKRYLMPSPTGVGKSLVALAIGVTIVEHGGTVAILDVENGGDEYARRLGDVLAARDPSARGACRDRLAYHEWPTLRLTWRGPEWAAALAGVDLVVFDSSRMALSSVGLDEDSNDDYARFVNALLIPLARADVTTLTLDNTGHEARNRARGASAKHDLNEVVYLAKVGAPFDCDQHGHVRLLRERTRFSGLPRELHVPLGGGIYGPAQVAEDADAMFRPTVLMERVSRAVEETPGLSTRAIREAVKGDNNTISYALELLVIEEYVDARPEETPLATTRSGRTARRPTSDPTALPCWTVLRPCCQRMCCALRPRGCSTPARSPPLASVVVVMASSPLDPHRRSPSFDQASDGFALGVPAELVEAIAERTADLLAERLPDRPEPYMSVEEAASYLGCKPKRVYELVAQDRLAHFRDGRRLLFRRADLDAALVRREPE